MRLIDANVLENHIKEVIKKQGGKDIDLIPVSNLLTFIGAEPTAYDVDAVVERLKKEKKRAFELCLAINDKAQRQQYIIKEQTMALAIEIVKGGGVDV